MTFFIAGALLTIGATSAYYQKEAGKQQKYDIKRQSDQESLAAQGEEISRRKRLNQVLAANVLSIASSGNLGEGTPQSIALTAARTISSSENLESLSAKMRRDLLKREGRAAYRASRINAASTLLSSGVTSVSLIGPTSGSKE